MPRKPADQSWKARAVRFVDIPQPGFFRLRLVRGGPWVPGLIYAPCPIEMEDPDYLGLPTEPYRAPVGAQIWSLRALVNGEDADPLEVWQRGQRVAPREYHRMIMAKARAEQFAPHEPEANPRRRIDLAKQPSLF